MKLRGDKHRTRGGLPIVVALDIQFFCKQARTEFYHETRTELKTVDSSGISL